MNAQNKALAVAPQASTSTGIVPQNMDQAIRLAEMMARGKMIPDHLRNSPGDCLMVVEQAMRWRMSPFAVAQCTSSVKGKLMFEGKLTAAAVETSGAIVGGFDYQFSGSGPERKIIVSARRVGEKEARSVEVTWKDAATSNEYWKKQPDQQLVYHGTRVWARRWTPSVMLGVYSPEEFNVAEPGPDSFAGTTISGTAEVVSQGKPPAASVATVESQHRTVAEMKAWCQAHGEKPTWGRFLDALERELCAAHTRDEVDAIVFRDDVEKAAQTVQNGNKARLDAIVKDALDRTDDGRMAPHAEDDFPGVVTPREAV